MSNLDHSIQPFLDGLTKINGYFERAGARLAIPPTNLDRDGVCRVGPEMSGGVESGHAAAAGPDLPNVVQGLNRAAVYSDSGSSAPPAQNFTHADMLSMCSGLLLTAEKFDPDLYQD